MSTRFCLALPAAVVALSLAVAQHTMRPPEKPVELLPGLGPHHHPIATKNPEAQKFFDQGLNLLYGFNHAEAARSFRRSAELDPGALMPLWGLGLALAPNYNRDIDPVSSERNKEGYDAVQKALALTAAPPHERAYAQALAKRYTLDPKADTKRLEVEYKDAM